jgi:hypothetical protein
MLALKVENGAPPLPQPLWLVVLTLTEPQIEKLKLPEDDVVAKEAEPELSPSIVAELRVPRAGSKGWTLNWTAGPTLDPVPAGIGLSANVLPKSC